MLQTLRSLPDRLRALPGALADRFPDVGSRLPAVGDRLPDLRARLPDAGTLRRGGTLLAVAGSVLAVLGACVRALAGRRADEEPDSDAAVTADRGPPRIAPLAGMVALVVMRLVIERLRGRTDREREGTAAS